VGRQGSVEVGKEGKKKKKKIIHSNRESGCDKFFGGDVW